MMREHNMKVDFRSLANNKLRNLTPYQPGKPIEELERELGITSSIKLASNENPLGPSPKVLSATQDILQKAHYYPDGSCYELKHAISKFLAILPEQITVGNGSENILELIVKAYLGENDSAIISQYAFLTIPILIKSYSNQATVVPAHNWGHDIHKMIEAIDEQTRILFLVNPNNPTGTFTTKKDFDFLMTTVPPHVLIVVDEAYAEYISHPDYPNTLDYLKNHPNLIITRTFSKVYGLAALRLGYSISSVEIADILNRARLPFNVNTVATKAACIALEDQEHVQKSILLNQQGMEEIQKSLEEMEISYIPSLGNFITIEVYDAKLVYEKLLLEGVIVRPLGAYHMSKHIRVTIGTASQNKRFLNAFYKIIRERV